MKKSGIYQIKNKITNKSYVGSAIDIKDRWRCHIKSLIRNEHHSIYLQRSWNKYGKEIFNFQIIEECGKEFLIEREQYWIDNLDTYYNGYNVTPKAGSTLNFKFDEASKTKMSKIKAEKGKLLNQNISQINQELVYNKIIDDQKKEKIIDKNNPFYGKKHSEKSKKIMSEKKKGEKNYFYKKGPMLGKHLSETHKEKISLANTGKNNSNSKQLFQYDLEMNLIKTWDSVGVACKILNLSVGNISSCCNGKRRTAYGFIWKYN